MMKNPGEQCYSEPYNYVEQTFTTLWSSRYVGLLGVAEVSVTVEVGLFAEVLRKVDSSHAPSAQRLHVDKRAHFGI